VNYTDEDVLFKSSSFFSSPRSSLPSTTTTTPPATTARLTQQQSKLTSSSSQIPTAYSTVEISTYSYFTLSLADRHSSNFYQKVRQLSFSYALTFASLACLFKSTPPQAPKSLPPCNAIIIVSSSSSLRHYLHSAISLTILTFCHHCCFVVILTFRCHLHSAIIVVSSSS
jgi:hypothetical protein